MSVFNSASLAVELHEIQERDRMERVENTLHAKLKMYDEKIASREEDIAKDDGVTAKISAEVEESKKR